MDKGWRPGLALLDRDRTDAALLDRDRTDTSLSLSSSEGLLARFLESFFFFDFVGDPSLGW